MPDRSLKAIDQSVAISDPGEVGRSEHTWVDRLVVGVANISAWLFPLLMVAIVTQVIIRKMGHNQAWLDDAQWWIYGFAMMVGFAYAITTNSHVRVDILHQHFTPLKQARIEIFGLGWLLLPFLGIMTDILIHYAWSSITAREGSDSPNGLHMLFLLKTTLPLIFLLSIMAAWAVMVRNMRRVMEPTLWKKVIGALPFVWFAVDRVFYYIFYWFTRLSNPELNPRRINREPIFEYTTYLALAVIVAIIVVGYTKQRSVAGKDA
ncbi:TRAP-type mannitol/chloroaromatic compound transport system, small permease component [Rhodobacteraceae bacterium HTCC2150]|nr:TRAP-type mannitol/chloroaromatic compound transport system, small permease component [Rhodobacteraceae bacterium HTCC2150]